MPRKLILSIYIIFMTVVIVRNIPVSITLTMEKIGVTPLRFESISLEYVASLLPDGKRPAVLPKYLTEAVCISYVMERRRGWPNCYQNDYGLYIEVDNRDAGYHATSWGIPKANQKPWYQRLQLPMLALNIFGSLALLGCFHVSLAICVRDIPRLRGAITA